MENMYNEHEASVKNGSTFAKMGNGHTDSHADKVLLRSKPYDYGTCVISLQLW